MESYWTGSRLVCKVVVTIASLVAAFCIVTSSIMVIDKAFYGASGLFAFACASFYLAVWMLREIYEIQIARDGTIVFMKGWGRTTINVRDIRGLEGIFVRNSYQDMPDWSLRILYGAHAIELWEFPGVMDFVADIRKQYPEVGILGTWVMDSDGST